MAGHDFRGAVSRRKKNSIVYRESDVMREGMPAALLLVESNSVDIMVEEPMIVGESIKIELINEMQRFKVLVRARVCSIFEMRGESRVNLDLLNRLNPHELMTLRMQLRGRDELWF